MKKRNLSLVLSVLLFGSACGQDPVFFRDPDLKHAVEQELWISDPTPGDMLALTDLRCPDCQIEDLTGIEYAVNLQTLRLLQNKIVDLSPLADLTNLQELILEMNRVTDVSALSSLANLQMLNLHRNQIRDVSPLTTLTSLLHLDLRYNPLNEAAYATHLSQITANNPGIVLRHDPVEGRCIIVSSATGGSVIRPGEGTFFYGYLESVPVEAVARPGFLFSGWSGTYSSQESLIFLWTSQHHQIQPSFTSVREVLYVDDDAPADPEPGNGLAGDPSEDGTPEHPFDTIQEGVDVAAHGATILVAGGTYRENIDLRGKSITIVGTDLNDPLGTYPVLECVGAGPAVRFANGENRDCVLCGFVITADEVRSNTAILCSAASPTIANCLIVGNHATNPTGAAICCTDSGATFINCTITDNHGGDQGAGLALVSSPISLVNSIVWGNTPRNILLAGIGQPSIRYSDVAGGRVGTGDIDMDPLFASTGYWVDRYRPDIVVTPGYFDAVFVMGDYHLRSQTGRWNREAGDWVLDNATSGCINGGDPAAAVGTEPAPNGGTINVGAYGGTAQASKTHSEAPPL